MADIGSSGGLSRSSVSTADDVCNRTSSPGPSTSTAGPTDSAGGTAEKVRAWARRSPAVIESVSMARKPTSSEVKGRAGR
ncbi:hypothetical protein [Nocardia seriolae]|uniref:Uncharacterized protein n=1 Tax=Nocardia seriolae TaxID=37332 RepID=A0ABC9Z2T6_9NOCA|nr:hypothetical protein [Nocardia seriolae]QUN18590.1 hypothetical protein KEC46_03930 [Nocardia seriolae]WNJ61122.1 hypothetical protein RMO66_10720 [Nocardia seriolae]BEK97746.1 hypothetical protein NSER024013_56520 [Nocardia seriolae]GAP31933.1 hypothetical protein NSK11_contig00134-0002 [Nocardia seriolae]GEM27627.1 hypothetical protein NS2_58660 [Nocardia seriolae NBRC 15557]